MCVVAKPGVEQRQKDEKLQKEAASAKLRAIRAEAYKVRMEREAKLAEERRQGKVLSGPDGKPADTDAPPAYEFSSEEQEQTSSATPADGEAPPPIPPKK